MVVVYRHICRRIDRCQFVLCRRHFIMLGLGGHSHLPQFNVHIPHKACDTLPDRSEIMIVQLLAFRRHSAKQSTTRIDQVLPLLEFLCIHQKILLLRSYRRRYLF